MIQVRFFFLERLQVRYWAIRRRSKLHRAAPCRDRFICFSPGVHDQPTATRHSTVGGHVYNKLSSRSYRDGQSTCPKHFYRAETTNTSFGEQLEFSNVIRLKVIQHGEQEIWDFLSLEQWLRLWTVVPKYRKARPSPRFIFAALETTAGHPCCFFSTLCQWSPM